MKGKLIVAVVVLLCLAAGAVRASSDVTTLTPENFDQLTVHGVWLLKLYAISLAPLLLPSHAI